MENPKRGKQGKWKISEEKSSKGVNPVKGESSKEEYQ